LSQNIKKYGIENFELGCQVYNNLEYYNELVRSYLKKEKNIVINELYELKENYSNSYSNICTSVFITIIYVRTFTK